MDAEPLSQCGDNEDLDPRIQHELDTLNKASVDINILEKSLEEERQNYEKLFTGVTQNLNFLQAKLKSAIEKSRPYYDVKEKVKFAHGEVQSAAKRYDRAISTHQAAQQMVSVAETGFQNSSRAARSTLVEDTTSNAEETDSSKSKDRRNSRGASSEVNTSGSFDLAWQEMLNVAVSKVNEAERELSISEAQHQTKMKTCVAIESQLKLLEKDLKGSIKKSRPYYEAKSISNFQLEEQLRRIKHLEGKIVESKQKYTAALCNLEAISEEIHFRRESKRGPRGQGVGAETTEDNLAQNKTETLSEETVLTFNKTSAEKFGQNGDSSVKVTPKPEKSLTNKPSSEREGPIGVDADFKTPLAASKSATLSEKLTASTESKASLRSQYSTLTPEDAKKLAKGETKIDEFLNINEEFSEADKFSIKIEADLKKLSTADLSSSFQNMSTHDFDGDENDGSSSCVSTLVKSRREIVDSGNSSRSSFSTTDQLPSSVSITTSASSSLHSKSKSDEFLYHQDTSN